MPKVQSSETCNNTDEEWVMYKNREEWADLKPVKQNDGSQPVVKIAYSEDFIDVYDYFRGVVAAGELSQRALLLTEDAIHMNAANYTVWQYRRRILEHLNSNLEEELDFCREMIEANAKNYQVWHHRRVIVGWLGDGSKELRLTRIIFAQDAKNYHAWEHRQWSLRTFGLYENELEFTEQLLNEDQRNNSAWNHRYFVLCRTTGLTTAVLKKEIQQTWRSIAKLQDNESPWTYIKGLLQDTTGDGEEIQSCWRDLEKLCWELIKERVEPSKLSDLAKGDVSCHLLIGLLDCLVHNFEQREDKEQTLQTALQICELLGSTHDAIRTRYWRYLSRKLQQQYGA
uniref:Protein farnesyltransferase/geranylgeranyltransferase type-1 subunit alpha n=1 Tax=Hirondellea gigas TaxID=1518452 RepID=A0A2P2I7J2_9CRUS